MTREPVGVRLRLVQEPASTRLGALWRRAKRAVDAIVGKDPSVTELLSAVGLPLHRLPFLGPIIGRVADTTIEAIFSLQSAAEAVGKNVQSLPPESRERLLRVGKAIDWLLPFGPVGSGALLLGFSAVTLGGAPTAAAQKALAEQLARLTRYYRGDQAPLLSLRPRMENGGDDEPPPNVGALMAALEEPPTQRATQIAAEVLPILQGPEPGMGMVEYTGALTSAPRLRVAAGRAVGGRTLPIGQVVEIEAWLQTLPPRGQVRAALLAESWVGLLWEMWAREAYPGNDVLKEAVTRYVDAVSAAFLQGELDAVATEQRFVGKQRSQLQMICQAHADRLCGPLLVGLDSAEALGEAFAAFAQGADADVFYYTRRAVVLATQAWLTGSHELELLPGFFPRNFDDFFHALVRDWESTRPADLGDAVRDPQLSMREAGAQAALEGAIIEAGRQAVAQGAPDALRAYVAELAAAVKEGTQGPSGAVIRQALLTTDSPWRGLVERVAYLAEAAEDLRVRWGIHTDASLTLVERAFGQNTTGARKRGPAPVYVEFREGYPFPDAEGGFVATVNPGYTSSQLPRVIHFAVDYIRDRWFEDRQIVFARLYEGGVLLDELWIGLLQGTSWIMRASVMHIAGLPGQRGRRRRLDPIVIAPLDPPQDPEDTDPGRTVQGRVLDTHTSRVADPINLLHARQHTVPQALLQEYPPPASMDWRALDTAIARLPASAQGWAPLYAAEDALPVWERWVYVLAEEDTSRNVTYRAREGFEKHAPAVRRLVETVRAFLERHATGVQVLRAYVAAEDARYAVDLAYEAAVDADAAADAQRALSAVDAAIHATAVSEDSPASVPAYYAVFANAPNNADRLAWLQQWWVRMLARLAFVLPLDEAAGPR